MVTLVRGSLLAAWHSCSWNRAEEGRGNKEAQQQPQGEWMCHKIAGMENGVDALGYASLQNKVTGEQSPTGRCLPSTNSAGRS